MLNINNNSKEGRCQTFRETKISIIVFLLQFAELFACVTYQISTVADRGQVTFFIWIYRPRDKAIHRAINPNRETLHVLYGPPYISHFAEVFIVFNTFAEVYHELFHSTVALRNTVYVKIS